MVGVRVLPMIPFKEMFLSGEVVRSVEAPKENHPDPEYEVSIVFKGMKESEKEQIIRYVVKRQMQTQREKQESLHSTLKCNEKGSCF